MHAGSSLTGNGDGGASKGFIGRAPALGGLTLTLLLGVCTPALAEDKSPPCEPARTMVVASIEPLGEDASPEASEEDAPAQASAETQSDTAAGANEADAATDDADADAAAVRDKDKISVVVCHTRNDNGEPVTLEIGSLKLDELSTSALLNDWMPEKLAARLGNIADVVRTEVYAEIRKITSRFAESNAELAAGTRGFSLSAPGVDWDSFPSEREFREIALGISRFGAVNGGLGTLRYEIAPRREIVANLATTEWPNDASFWYGSILATEGGSLLNASLGSPLSDRKRGVMAQTLIWQYMRASDVHAFYENQLAFESGLNTADDAGLSPRALKVPAAQGSYGSPRVFGIPKFFEALAYFGRAEFPPDLAVVYSGLIDGSWESFVFPRHVMLEVVTVKNTSEAPLELRQLGLTRYADVQLRRLTPPGETGNWELVSVAKENDEVWLLEPKEVLIIPVRITLEYGPDFIEAVGEERREGAMAFYEGLQGYDPDTMMEYHDYQSWIELLWSKPLLRKRRAGMLAPQVPSLEPYVHDAELRLAYLETPGGRLWPSGVDPAAISFTVRTSANQCPYLYAWDEAAQRFIPHGKILVTSNVDYSGREERIPFDRPVFKFRIAEKEMEVSYIDQVELEVRMRDGRALRLRGEAGDLAREDGAARILKQGDFMDFAFHLPGGESEAEVAGVVLHVRGHYERYGKLLLQSLNERARN